MDWLDLVPRALMYVEADHGDALIHVLGVFATAFLVYLRWSHDKRTDQENRRREELVEERRRRRAENQEEFRRVRDTWLDEQQKLQSGIAECRHRLATESPAVIDGELIHVIPELWFWSNPEDAHNAPGYAAYTALRSEDRARAALDRFSYHVAPFVLEAAGAYIFIWHRPGGMPSGDQWRVALIAQLRGLRAALELFEQNVYVSTLGVAESRYSAEQWRNSQHQIDRRTILMRDIKGSRRVNPEWHPILADILALLPPEVPESYQNGEGRPVPPHLSA